MKIDKDYKIWITSLKDKICSIQIKAAIAVNVEMILLYWDIGKSIVEKQKSKHWGAGLIKQMAKDLKSELPGVSGFSQSNLYVMRQFYLFYHNAEILQQPAGILQTRLSEDENKLLQQAAGILSSDSLLVKIPWWHHQVILSNCNHEKDALFYIQQTILNNWSRNVLQIQIKSNLFQRQGKSINNFEHSLPKPQSDLARETLKDSSKEHFHRAQPSASQPHSYFVWYQLLVPIPKQNVAGSIYLLLVQN